MRALLAVATVLGMSGWSWAQQIDHVSRIGPNGTHFNIELPADNYTYEGDTYCVYSYNHLFQVYHNETLKHSESFDVLLPAAVTYFSRTVDFTGWNLQVGDTVRFYNRVRIIAGPHRGKQDTDNQYGDCVDLISQRPMLDEGHLRPLCAAIEERDRYERLWG